jgi:excisionase family DNA binding protein
VFARLAVQWELDNFWTLSPARDDARLAAGALPLLTALLDGRRSDQPLHLQTADGEELILPVTAARMLEALLRELAGRNLMALVPLFAELTTQRAAAVLNVSRPTLVRLLDAGEIRSRRVGRHRRVRLQDLLAYRRRNEPRRRKLETPTKASDQKPS